VYHGKVDKTNEASRALQLGKLRMACDDLVTYRLRRGAEYF